MFAAADQKVREPDISGVSRPDAFGALTPTIQSYWRGGAPDPAAEDGHPDPAWPTER
jgi:hypothetical protein